SSSSRSGPGSTSQSCTTTIAGQSWRSRRARLASVRLRKPSRRGSSEFAAVFGSGWPRSIARDLFVAHQVLQYPAADFVGIGVAAVAEDDDAKLPVGHHPDIGRGIVEPAILADDGRVLATGDFPGERLRVVCVDGEYALLRQVHGRGQRGRDRYFAHIGRKKSRHVARRGIHLAGARPVVVALLVARLADRRAVLRIALHGPALVLRAKLAERRTVASRQRRRAHAKRAQNAALDQLVDRHPELTLERQLQQDVSAVGVDVLPARLVVEVGGPFV